jgi:ATP-binding cassette subfamily B protein RaxB
MVCLRLGTKVSVEELRQRAAPGPQGLSLQQLRLVATDRGLACRCVRVSVDRLGQVSFPAIAHLSGGHYVVLHEFGPAGVVVGDPATGIVTWNLSWLAQCYTESLVLFDWPSRAPFP